MKTKIVTIGAVSACLFLSLGSMSADDKQAADKQQAQTAAKKPTPAPSATALPAGAVLTAPGTYSYTDPQGKKWIYRRTPFGVVRLDDSPERAAAKTAAVNGAGIKATEDGDTVHFERQGPFGLWKWDKKKSELDETEKAALRNSQDGEKTASKQDQ